MIELEWLSDEVQAILEPHLPKNHWGVHRMDNRGSYAASCNC
jgi:hypothetical protein